ncbi:hypothetical protein HDU97_003628 [Phlyctochytrium planicorne]|nr:hypothetical protein HDU97_003628 [Phlyctochytrium planicorne]
MTEFILTSAGAILNPKTWEKKWTTMHLPEELLLRIANLLPFPSIVHFACTNSIFNTPSLLKHLYRNFRLNDRPPSNDQLERYASHIESIELWLIYKPARDMLRFGSVEWIRKLKNLKAIAITMEDSFTDYNLEDEPEKADSQGLSTFLTSLPCPASIHSVKIYPITHWSTGQNLPDILPLLAGTLKDLKHLSAPWMMTSQFEQLEPFQSLESLHISPSCEYSEADSLPSLPRLQELKAHWFDKDSTVALTRSLPLTIKKVDLCVDRGWTGSKSKSKSNEKVAKSLKEELRLLLPGNCDLTVVCAHQRDEHGHYFYNDWNTI